METLRHAAAQTQAGRGQMVAVMADPGVGKSRLFYEFKAISKSGWMVLEAFAVSYGRASAYLPVLGLLSEYFEISSDHDERRRRELILGKVLGLDRALEDTLPYFYSLYGLTNDGDSLAGMDARIRRRRNLDAIKRLLLRESLNQPLMLIFEDLHWIDTESQALLNLVVDTIADARILLLVNYRPEYRHEWGKCTLYKQLRLDPLGRESAQQMLSVLMGDEINLIALKRLIIERTEGTPFFMEEMVQALFEEGVLKRNGIVTLARPLSAVKVPATVQAVLASRIDRLPAARKELLQMLAVLGREFPLDLVQCVTTKSSNELEEMLAQLELAEFVFEQPTSGGALEYIFKHALTQEVAYNSLLGELRRALHDRAAQAIEDLYGNQLEDHYGDLANHYLRGNDTSKATRYAELAAEQAISRGAYPQAMSLVETALKLVEKLPDAVEGSRAELGLHTIESTVAIVLHGASSKERERVIRRMCELAEALGARDQFVGALSTLSGLYFTQGESAKGLELATRCLTLSKGMQDNGLLLDLHYNAAALTWRCGKYQEAASLYEDGLRRPSRTNCRLSPQYGLLYEGIFRPELACILQTLGRVTDAAKSVEEGLRRTRDSRHLFSLGCALVIGAGELSLERRQPDIACVRCEEVIALSEENGFAEWLPWGRFIHGWALFELGQVSQGLLEMEAGLAGFDRLGGVPRQQYWIVVRARALAMIGRVDEALLKINQALAHIECTGDTADQAEMLRLKGEVLMMYRPSEPAEAEKCFRQARDVARAQEAKWWELRTIVSLARLLRDTNRRSEAHAMLTGIYNWFIEGFDLPDLEDAKALLDELGC
jgi:tetratricopeptide (TPR) repeat protein